MSLVSTETARFFGVEVIALEGEEALPFAPALLFALPFLLPDAATPSLIQPFSLVAPGAGTGTELRLRVFLL